MARQGDRADLPARGADDACPRSSTTTCPVAGAFHNCVIVSIRKAFPGHAQKVMHALWGLGMLSLTKSIVVVDEHVNVHDYADVFFRVTANVDPKRDVLISEGPLDHLDHAPGTAVLRREARHRRDAQASGGGRSRLAGGDRDVRGHPGAGYAAAGRSTASPPLTRAAATSKNPCVSRYVVDSGDGREIESRPGLR